MPASKPTSHSFEQQAHWHILGAGAIGSLYAYWLKERCTLLLRPNSEHADKNVLTLCLEQQNNQYNYTLPCTTNQQVNNIKHLLICTKANHTQQALKDLILEPGTNIVLLQNGMGNADLLKDIFPHCSLFCASTTHGAYRKSNTQLVHAGEGSTYLGSLDSSITEASIHNICNALSSQSENVKPDSAIEKRLWLKLAMNCAINPLSVIYQCKNGELLTTNNRLSHLKKICLEIDDILRIKGFLTKEESSFNLVKKVAQDTANNYSSMFQDNKYKRMSEIDFIQGYLLKEAQKHHIELPENQNLLTTIKKIENLY